MPLLRRLLLLLLCVAAPCCDQESKTQHPSTKAPAKIPSVTAPATLIRPLIAPAKLATLGTRGTNPRVQKITGILWQAKQDGQDPAQVADRAVGLIGWGDTEKGRLTAAAMLRNVTIIERLGADTPADIEAMKRNRWITLAIRREQSAEAAHAADFRETLSTKSRPGNRGGLIWEMRCRECKFARFESRSASFPWAGSILHRQSGRVYASASVWTIFPTMSTKKGAKRVQKTAHRRFIFPGVVFPKT